MILVSSLFLLAGLFVIMSKMDLHHLERAYFFVENYFFNTLFCSALLNYVFKSYGFFLGKSKLEVLTGTGEVLSLLDYLVSHSTSQNVFLMV